MSFPNVLRLLSTLLCAASFFPQIRRIWARQDTTGIRTSSVLFNFIGASEHFIIILGTGGLSNLSDEQNWPEILHGTVLWLLFGALFFLKLRHNDDEHPRPPKIIYGVYFVIAVLPMLFFILVIGYSTRNWDEIPRSLLSAVHSVYLTPISTGLWIAAVNLQLKETEPGSRATSALSVHTLAYQAVVFGIDAIFWVVPATSKALSPEKSYGPWGWYVVGGFMAVDGLIFAVGQAMILYRVQGSLRFPWGTQENSASYGTRLGEGISLA